MDTESDLTSADRDFLIAIIAQLQATILKQQRVIERLEQRIAALEGQTKPEDPEPPISFNFSITIKPPSCKVRHPVFHHRAPRTASQRHYNGITTHFVHALSGRLK